MVWAITGKPNRSCPGAVGRVGTTSGTVSTARPVVIAIRRADGLGSMPGESRVVMLIRLVVAPVSRTSFGTTLPSGPVISAFTRIGPLLR